MQFYTCSLNAKSCEVLVFSFILPIFQLANELRTDVAKWSYVVASLATLVIFTGIRCQLLFMYPLKFKS